MSLPGPDGRLRDAEALLFVPDLDDPRCAEEDAHHLLDVLRLGEGALVAASDGAGRFRICRLSVEAGASRGRRGRGALLEGIGETVSQPAPPGPVTVAFALLKGERTEWAVQKLTELGVDRIVPLLTARTVVRLDLAGAARRAERLRRVAREAAAQARRTRLPELAEPTPLAAFLAAQQAAPGEDGRGLTALAEPGAQALDGRTRRILVGPEGGWAPEELQLVGHRVGLGPNVLRAETAAVVAGTLLTAARSGTLAGPAND